MIRMLSWPLIVLLAATLAACAPEDTKDDDSDTIDATPYLTQYVDNAVVADYSAFNSAAQSLQTALATLQSSVTAGNVTAARTAWLATRVPWERSEAWLFGPVDSNGIDPAVDTWPLDTSTMSASLGANAPYPTNNDDIKGFHAIEYVLWSVTGTKNDSPGNVATTLGTDSDILTNLLTIASDLADQTDALVDGWTGSGNFREEFISAGNGSSVYVSQSAAMQEIVNGMIGIADEVASGKIGGPLGDGNSDNVESQYSFNSITDFENNIRGIQIAYLGEYSDTPTQQSNSLSTLVASRNAALDTAIRSQIDAAIAAVQGMDSNDFHDGNPQGAAGGSAAVSAIQALQATLQGQLLPLIQNLNFTH